MSFRNAPTGQGYDKYGKELPFKQGLKKTHERYGKEFRVNHPDNSRPIGPHPRPQPTGKIHRTRSTGNSSSGSESTASAPDSFEIKPVRRQHSWREIKLTEAVKCFLKKLCSTKFTPLEDKAWRCKHCKKTVCFKCTRDREPCTPESGENGTDKLCDAGKDARQEEEPRPAFRKLGSRIGVWYTYGAGTGA